MVAWYYLFIIVINLVKERIFNCIFIEKGHKAIGSAVFKETFGCDLNILHRSSCNRGQAAFFDINFCTIHQIFKGVFAMSKKILVIDDSPFVYKAVKRALQPGGYEIVGHALNGRQGLEMIEALKPDLITLDITMPLLDGLETSAILIEQNSPVKIIILSAMGDEMLVQQAKEMGVQYFIPKPFDKESLLKLVNQILIYK
mgnify:CR=1 FL=1